MAKDGLVEFSIIVPAYNEEKRIKPFLQELKSFCGNFRDCEVLFVDDGSKDNTLGMLKRFKKGNKRISIVSYPVNRGKGHAVRTGVLNSRGKKIIFIDSDGSTRPKMIQRMVKMLDSYDVVVGSRAHKDSRIKTSVPRRLTGVAFNAYANLLFHNKIRDHLCGFKGFRRGAALVLFENLIDERWVFDVELFYKARKNKFKLHQLPIEWSHKGMSKIRPGDIVKIFFELMSLRIKLLR